MSEMSRGSVKAASLLAGLSLVGACSRTTPDVAAVDASGETAVRADAAAPDTSDTSDAASDASDAAHDACAPGPCWITSGGCGARTSLWECPIVDEDAGDAEAYPASLPAGCQPQSLNGLFSVCSGVFWCCP